MRISLPLRGRFLVRFTRRRLDRHVRATRQRGYGLLELLVTTVVMIAVLSLTAQTIIQFQRGYRAQNGLIDAQYNARAALDLLVRLIRNAQTVMPDPDGNGVFDTIGIVGDWNPPNGVVTDSYETVLFTAAGGVLSKQEPGDLAPVPFADRIESMAFSYFDTNDAPIANPVLAAPQITLVRIVVVTTAQEDAPALTLNAAAVIRARE
jgi:type II secretory pathway pseudopilin PulG